MNRSAPLVQWTAFPVATEPPRAVPILLAAVAGFVDACTYLGLFGFFVAQVTGSYVLAGAHPVAGSPGRRYCSQCRCSSPAASPQHSLPSPARGRAPCAGGSAGA